MKYFRYIKVTTDYGDDLFRLESMKEITKEVVLKFLQKEFPGDQEVSWCFDSAPAHRIV
jgi:hypothetical protein